ncbi:F-box domain-containing protein [Mycena indigotica]|uniref:F-box domain-containing protein n=1 Tax=Mycena indigotica TaxID=2126181 RepID=A0A8H6S6K3_9AGAR|nr:F-box domain-containing protein [Mycena indigotica]KAF7293021.1 F-box domain-containing protein [Mycena indigotica]
MMLLNLSCVLATLLAANAALALASVGYTSAGKPILHAPSGSLIRQSGQNLNVFAPDGSLLHVLKGGNEPATTLSRRFADSDFRSVEALAVVDGPATMESLTTTFTIPPVPKTFNSQLFFFGAGIGIDSNDSSITALVQAGLQYGGTPRQGGSFWSAAIVIQAGDGTLLSYGIPFGTAIVHPGDRLTVSIARDTDPTRVPPGDGYWYLVTFDHLDLAIPYTAEMFWEIPPSRAMIRLEELIIDDASEYPVGAVVFENVKVNTTAGFPAISWHANNNPALNVQVNVEQDGSENARIAIAFPESN